MGFLQREPVRNNIVCTLTQVGMRREASADGQSEQAEQSRWLRVLDGRGEVVGAAILVPPHFSALLPTMPDRAARRLAEHLATALPELPGVDGPADAAAALAGRYSELAGVPARPEMRMLVFALDRVTAPAGVPGHPRPATPDDLDLVLDWSEAFEAEALPDRPVTDQARELVRDASARRLAEGRDAWLWQVDGVPVSYVHRTLLAPVGAVPTIPAAPISGVYTPPRHRGHGYASANVAALSQLCLDEGIAAVLLYTDESNPTSYKIYQQIGYRLVGRAQRWRFSR
jgi:RimJ/RimL family protein N-acetyltransferase